MTVKIITGDCRDALRTMPDQSVHCCVTSPPYFGLRDYGVEGQMGLEETPEAFIAGMVAVFEEVRRVLRNDGTLWLNIGDSYCSTDKWGGGKSGNTGKQTVSDDGSVPSWAIRAKRPKIDGVKPKDLIGIPWMLAFALRSAGWYLRQDIIWSKPNPMPESVRDRCTKAHEYLFLLSKSERYHYDAEAITEAATGEASGRAATFDRGGNAVAEHVLPGQSAAQHRPRPQQARAREIAAAAGLTQEHLDAIRACGVGDAGKAQHTQDGHGKNDPAVQALADHAKAVLGGYYREFLMSERRNKRSVWTVPTQPFKEAHFATFPPDLIVPCIKAGCPIDGTVLDPFGGAGTTGLVADRLQRHAVLIELNPKYADMARTRLTSDAPLLADVE